ncbi:MAG: VCBS repeat-containing protein [Anaerolineaceae bacterium]|nr:VCBS repeat-containing protein [Anaerolineaceae bacterium]
MTLMMKSRVKVFARSIKHIEHKMERAGLSFGLLLLLLFTSLPACNIISRAESLTQKLNFLDQEESQVSNSIVPVDHKIIDTDGPQGIWQKSVGDLNGDGLIDLIVGGFNDGGLVWYRNPDWEKEVIAPGSGHSTDGEVGDIDQDGDADYVSLTGDELRWYQNPDWTVFTIDNRPLHDLELSDFDRDGDLDAVARNQGEFGSSGDELHFYRQDSPFAWTHHSISVPNGEGLAVGDIDNDGLEDVIVNGRWYQNSGDIMASWKEHIYTNSWLHPNAFIAIGDLNNDDRLDIALAPAELEGQTYRLSWFEAPRHPVDITLWTEHIVVDDIEAVHHYLGIADIDNDNDQDIVTAEMAQGSDPDEVSIFNNGGDGLSWTKQVLSADGSHSMRLMDIDNDGDIDLFGANWQGNTVELWENLSCQETLGSWERHQIDEDKTWQAVFISSGDLNGDEFPDVITGKWWYVNPGNAYSHWTRHAIGDLLNNMANVIDLDGDGDLDILGTQGVGSDANASFVWAQNDGLGNFTIFNNIEEGEGDFLQGVASNTFQQNSALEIMLSWHGGGQGIQRLLVPENPTATFWSWEKISQTSQDEDLSSGDIDGDGDNDLLLGTKWLRNDNNKWTDFTLFSTDKSPDRNELVDLNGDGKLDALVGYEAISEKGVLAWYAQGSDVTSPWTEHVISDSIIGPMSLDVADMDHDGDLDVIAGEHNLNEPDKAQLFVFENVDGSGTKWVAHLVYTGDEHHDGAQVVDIDLDGDLDILSIGWGHNQVLVYENKFQDCGKED